MHLSPAFSEYMIVMIVHDPSVCMILRAFKLFQKKSSVEFASPRRWSYNNPSVKRLSAEEFA